MKQILVVLLVILLSCTAASAAPSWGQSAALFGLATVGSIAGVAVAIAVIAEVAPEFESGFGSTAVVIGSLTLFDGLGAAAGVLTAGKIWQIDGNVSGSILGGMAGGLASAFVEPLLYMIGIPEGWTEFFGMALLPILPALGAMLGYGQ